LKNHATKNQLDPAWVFALVRAESAFIEDVRSPAGALGLMQVMPKTGEMTARRLGMNNFTTNHLTRAEHNVPIGSKYLRMMYDDFNGNVILATAAYNAGPHRVRSWLPETGCIEPDVWIENIPFLETRNYVKRVLEYSSIYEWRLEREIKPLAQRMTAVQPRRQQTLVAGMSCTGPAVSMTP
jgi:soluble lytic murein transglycosylase